MLFLKETNAVKNLKQKYNFSGVFWRATLSVASHIQRFHSTFVFIIMLHALRKMWKLLDFLESVKYSY